MQDEIFAALSPFRSKANRKTVTRVVPASRGPGGKVWQPAAQEVILGLFGEYVGLDELAWSGGLVQLLGDLGFSGGASRVALNRSHPARPAGPGEARPVFLLQDTPRLKLVHDEGRRQTFSATIDPPWSAHWTLTWYAVPEARRLQRARLGRWLNLHGFWSAARWYVDFGRELRSRGEPTRFTARHRKARHCVRGPIGG